jgi:hypothetical protein
MDPSPSFADALLLPFSLLFVAAMIYGLSFSSGRQQGKLPTSRWVGVVFGVLALLVGLQKLWLVASPGVEAAIYRQSIVQRRVLWGHYIAFVFPLIFLGVVAYLEKRKELHEAEL